MFSRARLVRDARHARQPARPQPRRRTKAPWRRDEPAADPPGGRAAQPLIQRVCQLSAPRTITNTHARRAATRACRPGHRCIHSGRAESGARAVKEKQWPDPCSARGCVRGSHRPTHATRPHTAPTARQRARLEAGTGARSPTPRAQKGSEGFRRRRCTASRPWPGPPLSHTQHSRP
jgi:hypothetical protein